MVYKKFIFLTITSALLFCSCSPVVRRSSSIFPTSTSGATTSTTTEVPTTTSEKTSTSVPTSTTTSKPTSTTTSQPTSTTTSKPTSTTTSQPTSTTTSKKTSSTTSKTSTSKAPSYRDRDTRNLSPQERSLYSLVGTSQTGVEITNVDSLKANNKYVGIFYSIWLGQHYDSNQKNIYNITTLEITNPGALADTGMNALSPVGEFHFWGEPLFGYYDSSDPYIIQKHLKLLSQCGIDYLLLDATNSFYYPAVCSKLLEAIVELCDQGFNPPKVVFYTNSYSGTTANKIYNAFYSSSKYMEAFFAPNGKPLMVGVLSGNYSSNPEDHNYDYINNYDWYKKFSSKFEFYQSQWPYMTSDTNYAIPWMDWNYPQQRYNALGGTMSVSVAQHPRAGTYFSLKKNESHRGYNHATGQLEDWKAGANFQYEWNNAHSRNDINNVIVTGWNEWMAIKQADASFVDVYDQVYSRDCEMMKDGYADNYYLQLMQNVRRFKFNSGKKYHKDYHTIFPSDVYDEEWNYVDTCYADIEGDAVKRDYYNAAHTSRYQNNTARNDIKEIKVCHDSKNLFFRIICADDITERESNDQTYMNILLKSKDNVSNGLMGCNYIINRSCNGSKCSVEKINGTSFNKVGDASIYIEDNIAQVTIPLSLLDGVNDYCDIDFKISDHVTNITDPMDYYVNGDSAPLGRLRFSY